MKKKQTQDRVTRTHKWSPTSKRSTKLQKKAVTCLYVAGRDAPGACVTDGESVAHRLEKCTGATSSAPQLHRAWNPATLCLSWGQFVCVLVSRRPVARAVVCRFAYLGNRVTDDPAWTLEPLHSSNTYTQTHTPAREPTTPLGWFDRVLAARFPCTWYQLAGARDGLPPRGYCSCYEDGAAGARAGLAGDGVCSRKPQGSMVDAGARQ